MSITLDLTPETEHALRIRAQAQGISLSDYLNQLAEREAKDTMPAPRRPSGQALVDASAKVRGLLTDEEVDSLFARNRSAARSIDLG